MTQSVCWECGDATLFFNLWLSSRVKQTLCTYALPGGKHLTTACLAPLQTLPNTFAFALGLHSPSSIWIGHFSVPFVLLLHPPYTSESHGEVWDSAVLVNNFNVIAFALMPRITSVSVQWGSIFVPNLVLCLTSSSKICSFLWDSVSLSLLILGQRLHRPMKVSA